MNASQLIALRFRINDLDKDLLGRGGMGEVYRATDTQTGELVAVKVLNPEVVAHAPDLVERFVREGEALRQLNHPNIVRMIAAVQEQGQHYLIVEYVCGGSLEDLLRKQGHLPSARAIEIALEVADALTRAHHLGIIHRDLKPANVLLAQDGTPRLADFGIAHVVSSPRLTQTGVLIGTVDYLSPEVCQGEPPDERADIWAFGVMLFEMLSGRWPFEGNSLTAKLTAILTQPVPDLAQLAPDVPDALADLVYRMLEKDRQQRIPSVRLVGAELEALLKGREPVTPSRVTRAESRFATPTPSANAHAPRHNLPVQATPFVGREAELTELARLLADPDVRLLTILGVGGIGKTRLSLEVGAAQLNNYPNGVYFVPLAPLDSSEAIVPAIAQALGFSFYERGEPRQQLLDYLREKSMLLILDNFEHLLNGAILVTEILQAAPRVKILCTTRTRLDIPGEQLFHLEGMEFPARETPADAMEYSAVKLFLQSARRVRPGFELVVDDLKYVARICRVVGGMPLGILLAAAWVEMLTPQEIAGEMQRSLDFLETGQQSIPERQRSMRGVFDYAWNSLNEREQQAFCAVSVFRGGFTREAAQEVTQASLRELMGLVNKSLLQRDPGGRYQVHELLRQYAAEQLGQAHEMQDRHCAYYAGFLQQRESHLFDWNQRAMLAEMGAEIDNLRAGWEWAVATAQVQRINDYLESLGELHRMRGWYQEGEESFAWAAERLAQVKEESVNRQLKHVLGKVLAWQGWFCHYLGHVEKAGQILQASLALSRELGDQRETAYTLCYLGGEENELLCREALDIFREIGDRKGTALTLQHLGLICGDQGELIEARNLYQESLAIFRELGNPDGIARSLDGLGYVTWILGEYKVAQQLHQEGLAIQTEIGNRGGIASSLHFLGIDACGLREYEEAERLWQESLTIYTDISVAERIATVLGDIGEVLDVSGDYRQALQRAQEGLALHQKIGYRWGMAWCYRVLGNAACGLRELEAARKYFCQALQATQEVGAMGVALLTLVGIASLFTAEGEKEQALELLALVFHHQASWQWAKDRAAPVVAQLEAELPPDVVAAAKERGRARDLNATVAELLVELKE
jgi:predicted ATPase